MRARELLAHKKSAKITFERIVAAGKNWAPMVLMIKDNVMVAQVLPPGGDGEQISLAAQLAAEAFQADEVLIITDTYMAETKDNPLTGKEWERGDMAKLAERYDGIAKGWIVDCLMLLLLTREPFSSEFIGLTYSIPDGKHVEWKAEKPAPPDGAGTGRLVNAVFDSPGIFTEELPPMVAAALLCAVGIKTVVV